MRKQLGNRLRIRTIGILGVGFFAVLAMMQIVFGNSAAPPASKTGAPGENRCNQCHTGTAGTGSVSMIFGNSETQYIPGAQYTIQVNVTDATKVRFGFQMTSLAGGVGATVGIFTVVNSTNTSASQATVSGNLRRYMAHKTANTTQNWSFMWTAPATDVGPITFFLVGIAANNSGSSSGDKLYSTTFTITAVPPPPPVAGFTSATTSTCPGGSVAFTDTSTNFPSSHQWSFPGGNPASSTLENPVVVYTSPGTFPVTLIVSNVSGTDTLEQTNFIVAHTPPQVSATSVATSCFEGADGSIDASGTGNGNLTYLWSNGSTQEDPTGLAAGTYHVTVSDGNGCTITDSFSVAEPVEIVLTLNATDANCGQSNGSATVSASGGTPGYHYLWSTGDTTTTATALAAGSYEVTVTDLNGCPQSSTVGVSNFGAPTGTVSFSSISCNGGDDGAIDLSISGGVGPFSYNWSNGDTVQDLSNLTAGTYTVTVTSFDGCVLTEVVLLDEPALLTVTSSSTPESLGHDGSATAAPVGGTSGYTYFWSDGQTTPTAVNLVAGDYTVTVTDANGCSAIDTVTVAFVVSSAQELPNDLFAVGPNPFDEYLLLKPNRTIVGKFVVHILDLKGRMVYACEKSSNGAGSVRIEPGPLPNGIYLLLIATAHDKMVLKVVKATSY